MWNESRPNPDDLLQRIIVGFREQQVPEAPDFDVSLPPDESSQVESIHQPKPLWRRIVMNRRFHVAAAVALLVAAAGILLNVSPNSKAKAVTFDEVQEAAAKIRSVSFRIQIFRGDQPPRDVKMMVLEPDMMRGEGSDGAVSITNGKEGLIMFVIPQRKKVMICPIYSPSKIMERFVDWSARLRDIPARATRKVSEREFEGRQVIEFIFKDDEGFEFSALVDANTKLPVRMEVDRGKKPHRDRVREVYTDFVFDVPLDESLFAIEASAPPEGYSVERHKAQPAVPGDKALVLSSGEGMGPVKFGMTADQVVELLGEPDYRSRMEVPVLPKLDLSDPSTFPEGTKLLEGDALKKHFEEKGLEEEAKKVTPGNRALVRSPDVPRADPPKGTKMNVLETLIYDSRGFRVHATSSRGVTRIVCSSESFSSRSFQGKTGEGITSGASWDDVLKTYGKPDGKRDGETLWYTSLGFSFRFRDGRLSSIELTPPQEGVEIRYEGNKLIKRKRLRPKKP